MASRVEELSARWERNAAFGARVARRREEIHMTQEQLADETERLGLRIAPSTISALEMGDRKKGASMWLLATLAQGLRCTPDYLLGWVNDPLESRRLDEEGGTTRVKIHPSRSQTLRQLQPVS